VSVCLSVNTITPEPLEISSRIFQGSSTPMVERADKFENGYCAARQTRPAFTAVKHPLPGVQTV